MEKTRIIIKVLDKFISIITVILAAILILYSLFVLYDNFNINRSSFSSWDLLKYKPAGDAATDVDYQKLVTINSDVIGWITVDDTNIDYAILHGKDNLEYSNKNAYKKFALSGSIYIETESATDFSDPYTILYGHHMDNGSMFGDIDQYRNKDFLMKHHTGLIQTEKCNYDLRPFACVETNAYDNDIYHPKGKKYEDLKDIIKERAITYDEEGANSEGRLLAMSTCADVNTNGRLVLFAKLNIHKGPVVIKNIDQIKRKALGHGGINSSWAVLNLICLILTLYTFLPLGNLQRKYGQYFYSKKMIKTLDKEDVVKDLKSYTTCLIIGTIIEACIAIGAFFFFQYTQNFHYDMTILDKWTFVMLGIFAIALLTDYICFRYRGKRTEKVANNNNNNTGEQE